MDKIVNVAIDGPSGSGKSTLAKGIAKALGYIYVDTGALYRAVGLYVIRAGGDARDADFVTACLGNIHLALVYREGTQHVLLNGEDVSDSIRTPEISMAASAVSAHPTVRTFLLELQREMARRQSVVMDGRDIGTVILPQADVKLFMVTNEEVRAERRAAELAEKGIHTTAAQVLKEQAQRDQNDRTRAVAPAVPAPDAIFFDNSEMTCEQALSAALAIIAERTKG